MLTRARSNVRIDEHDNVHTVSNESSSLTDGKNKVLAQPISIVPFQRLRWGIALLIVIISAGYMFFCLLTGAAPACQVATVTTDNHAVTTRTCGLPDVTNDVYLIAVVALLLLPDAKSIKVGGFEFQRLTGEIKEQADEINRLCQQVSQISFQASQVAYAPHLVTVVTEIGKEAVRGDTPAASLKAEEVLTRLVDLS
jgi:hypothetical protein